MIFIDTRNRNTQLIIPAEIHPSLSMYAHCPVQTGTHTDAHMDEYLGTVGPNHNGGSEHEYALTLQVHAAIIQRE